MIPSNEKAIPSYSELRRMGPTWRKADWNIGSVGNNEERVERGEMKAKMARGHTCEVKKRDKNIDFYSNAENRIL